MGVRQLPESGALLAAAARPGQRGEFFETLASATSAAEVTRFAPKQIFGDAATVVSLIDVKFKVRATGKEVIESDKVHLWHFDVQGKVSRFRHRADTWQHARSLQAD